MKGRLKVGQLVTKKGEANYGGFSELACFL